MPSSTESTLSLSDEDIKDINTITSFLAISDAVPSSSSASNEVGVEVEVYVLIGNAILETITTTLDHLQSASSSSSSSSVGEKKILVLCGGIGHSTSLLWEAVKSHEVYKDIYGSIVGLPEARVMEIILNTYYGTLKEKVEVLIEDQSTNCGLNALYTRDVLQDYLSTTPSTSTDASASDSTSGEVTRKIRMVIVQDPTMSLRTLASFQRAFKPPPPPPPPSSAPSRTRLSTPVLTFKSQSREVEVEVKMEIWSTFIPLIKSLTPSNQIIWNNKIEGEGEREGEGLWTTNRFLDLIMGEIPRLRDDAGGYGPNGKGFIEHVDLTPEVEDAFGRLETVFNHRYSR